MKTYLFENGEDQPIEVKLDANMDGEAYFKTGDFIAQVTRGHFEHPFHATRYTVLQGPKAVKLFAEITSFKKIGEVWLTENS